MVHFIPESQGKGSASKHTVEGTLLHLGQPSRPDEIARSVILRGLRGNFIDRWTRTWHIGNRLFPLELALVAAPVTTQS